MYRVLIVDDEPIICEGLRRSVRWSEFNCEVAGTAANGMEGLEKVRELKPDILISDISMNNMDGLAMVAAVKSERPDMEVTLLTGYRNFEYAQRAIKLGVTRFLLKPSRMDEIEEAITAMTDNLRSIGNMAFYRCAELSKINLPEGVQLGKDVFGQCRKLPNAITKKSSTGFAGLLDKILPF
jgi:YesN/AraC family two-component response regulator